MTQAHKKSASFLLVDDDVVFCQHPFFTLCQHEPKNAKITEKMLTPEQSIYNIFATRVLPA